MDIDLKTFQKLDSELQDIAKKLSVEKLNKLKSFSLGI